MCVLSLRDPQFPLNLSLASIVLIFLLVCILILDLRHPHFHVNLSLAFLVLVLLSVHTF